MTGFSIAVASAFLAGVAVASAADHTIRQKGKVFSESEITVKRGDELLFLNDDNIAHNVLSITAGNRFDLGLLNPGSCARSNSIPWVTSRSSARFTPP
jgi:plastocyanin